MAIYEQVLEVALKFLILVLPWRFIPTRYTLNNSGLHALSIIPIPLEMDYNHQKIPKLALVNSTCSKGYLATCLWNFKFVYVFHIKLIMQDPFGKNHISALICALVENNFIWHDHMLIYNVGCKCPNGL